MFDSDSLCEYSSPVLGFDRVPGVRVVRAGPDPPFDPRFIAPPRPPRPPSYFATEVAVEQDSVTGMSPEDAALWHLLSPAAARRKAQLAQAGKTVCLLLVSPHNV